MKESRRYQWVYPALFCLVTVLAAINAFWNLTDGGVYDWDEARQGINAYEMIRNGDYIVHTYEGEADYWNLKPPISMWLTAASYKVFGYNLLGLRFPSALLMVVATAVSMLFLRRAAGPVASVAGGLLFAATGTRFHHLFQTGDPDAPFFLFCMLACIFLYRAYTVHARNLCGCGLSIAGAFLTKATHVLPLFFVLLCPLFPLRKEKKFTLRELLLYLLLPMAAPVALWAGWRFSQDGIAFFREMLLYDVIGRVTSTVENHSGGFFFYAAVLFNLMGGWVSMGIILTLLLVTALWVTKTVGTPLDKVFLIIFGVMLTAPLLLFTLAPTKLGWYVYPSLIGLYYLTAYGAQLLAGLLLSPKKRMGNAVALLVCVLPMAVGSGP